MLVLGCGPGFEPSPKAREFSEQVKSDLILINQRIAAKVARGDIKAINVALEKIFTDALNWNNPMAYGIALLNTQGIFFAGRYPTKGAPQGVRDKDTSQNYSQYELVRAALDRAQTKQGVLYTQGGPVYMVCSPLTLRGEVVGAVILGFPENFVNQTVGVTRKDFMALDFSPG